MDGCELLPAAVRVVPPNVAKQLLDGDSSYAGGLQLESVDFRQVEQSAFFTIELREGRNRQIRRMCKLVGLDVLRIHRLRIGNIRLGALPPGHWRYFQAGESFI